MRERPTQRQRAREFFALICAFLLTFTIGRQVMPPSSHGPLVLEIVVYILLYGSLYALFWWVGGRIWRPPA